MLRNTELNIKQFKDSEKNDIHFRKRKRSRVCFTDNFLPPIFPLHRESLDMLHHGSVGRVQSKECSTLNLHSLICHFLLFFIKSKLCFYFFHSFF